MAVQVYEQRVVGDPGFVLLRFDHFELMAHEESGFFNATKLCRLGGEDYKDYKVQRNVLDGPLSSKFGHDLLRSFADVNAGRTSPASGKYVHPLKLLYVACWLSDELYVKCAVAAAAFFARTPQRLRKLNSMLKIGEGGVREDWFDERRRIRRVDHADAELLVNEDAKFLVNESGLINVSKLGDKYRPYEYYERTDGGRQLLDLLRRYFGESCHALVDSAEPINGTYAHPIAAMRLLVWRGPREYSKLANVIFARMCAASAPTVESGLLAPIAALEQHRPNRVSCDDTAGAVDLPSASTAAVDLPSASTAAVDLPSASTAAVDLPSASTATVDLSSTSTAAVDLPSASTAAVDLPSASTAAVDLPSASTAAVDLPSASTATVDLSSTSTAAVDLPSASTAAVDLPSASTAAVASTAYPNGGPTRIVWDDGHDNDQYNDTAASLLTDADGTLTLLKKEHEVAMARLRREKESEIQRLKRENLSRETELGRLASEKAAEAEQARAELARLVDEKEAQAERLRSQESEIEELRRQIEDISLRDERLRVSTLKRDLRACRIRDHVNRRGVEFLECVLAVRLKSMPNTLYAFRRPFSGLVPTVTKKLEDVDEFVFWYATDNAARDFDEGKTAAKALCASVSPSQVSLSMTQNAISVKGEGRARDDVTDLVRAEVDRVLRAMGLVELNVDFLEKLFRDKGTADLDELAQNADSETERKAYEWMRNEFEKESNKKRRTRDF